MGAVSKYAVACAAVLFAACASMNGSNPTAQTVQTPQQRSEKALQGATDAQKRANDQSRKAAEARQDVQKKQQELQAAQEKARQEQAKAEQLQQQANQQTQQASREAQQSQHQAAQALSQQTRQTEQGLMTLRGQVSQANSNEIIVGQSGEKPMTFRVTNDTDIRIDGRQANASDIQPGENALVAYEVSGTQPTARSVQIVTGRPAMQGGSSSSSTSPSSTGSYGSGSTSGSSTTPDTTTTTPSR